jgi:hypothetical protein
MMQSAQHWPAKNVPSSFDCARYRCVLVQRRMCARLIVQRRLRTPTGPFFARFFIGIILGLVAEFAFMGLSTRLTMSFFAALWTDRRRTVGWKFRHGCSTERHAMTPGF